MSDRDDDILPADDVTPAPDVPASGADPVQPAYRPSASRSGGPALFLSVLALAGAGFAAWQAWLAARADHNSASELQQRLEALETRLTENERRAARNNELAANLREQLAGSERLRQQLQSDLLALADRSARADALIADLARGRTDATHMEAGVARLLLLEAESHLHLWDDREGAITALELAAQALTGTPHAAVRADIEAARAQVRRIHRPAWHEVQARLEEFAGTVASLLVSPRGEEPERDDGRGWWARQFDHFDHLVRIRREDEPDIAPLPGRESVRAALRRALLAAQAGDPEALRTQLQSARRAVSACCAGDAADALLAGLDDLLAIDWQAPLPDLSSLRRRLEAALPVPAVPVDVEETGTPPPTEQENPA